jgi:hypothetical protein
MSTHPIRAKTVLRIGRWALVLLGQGSSHSLPGPTPLLFAYGPTEHGGQFPDLCLREPHIGRDVDMCLELGVNAIEA